jgi:ABC-type glycerol-3-phosphate transport system substrate-binding protein
MKANVKKMIAMGLSLVLAVGTLTGCGGSSSSTTPNTGSGSASGSSAEGGDKAGGTTSSSKKTFDDLGGMDVMVGDWYYVEPDPTTDYLKETEQYRKEIQDQYNFKITRSAEYSYADQQTEFVNGTMANNPSCSLFYLYQEMVSEPLMKGLMKDLSKLPELDFTEEKWNPTVVELMSIGNGIWGMSTESEPRGGIFYNKRLFTEAGIPEDEPYDLQAANEWTWDKFEEYCKKLTKDSDGDGKTDQYAMASFSKYYLPMCAANNNATFIDRDENGEYVNAITTDEFLEAMNWGMGLMKKGYLMPKPEGAAWDWYKAAFRDAECAMQTAEVYEIGAFAEMEDDWGFVMFPYNQKNANATNKTTPNDNIVVMPECFDDETAEKIAFAFDLYTEPTPGYTMDDVYTEQYYPRFRDERAVDETLLMMKDPEHKQTSYLPMVSEVDYGDFCYSVYAGATKPAAQIEKISSKWDSKIKKTNENYKKFSDSH